MLRVKEGIAINIEIVKTISKYVLKLFVLFLFLSEFLSLLSPFPNPSTFTLLFFLLNYSFILLTLFFCSKFKERGRTVQKRES